MTASHGPSSLSPSEERPTKGDTCRCGRAWRDTPDARGVWRCGQGHPKPGTPGLALKHGGRSMNVLRGTLPSQEKAVELLGERQAAILADLGGADQVSWLRTDLVRRYLEMSLVADYLAHNMVRNGVLSAKGRTRAAVTTYVQVVDRLTRLANTLGLERQARPVGLAGYITPHHTEEPEV